MKIGILFFVTGHTVDPVTLGHAVEDAGFDSLWVPEHGVVPVTPKTPYPMTGGEIPDVYKQMADPFVLLGFLAAATTNLKLGTCVCLLPERHPLSVAKAVGTLDNFSGGRFLFGVGTGWLQEEVDLYGPYYERRWRYTRESVEAMKALWRDGHASYDGELVSFPDIVCEPRPVQRPHPPVLIGTMPTESGARRIARWGDGWIAMAVTPAQVAEVRTMIENECEAIGRDPAGIEISVGVRDATPETQEAFAEAGASRLIVPLYNHTGEPIPEDQWAAAAVATHTNPPPTPAETLDALAKVAKLAEL